MVSSVYVRCHMSGHYVLFSPPFGCWTYRRTGSAGSDIRSSHLYTVNPPSVPSQHRPILYPV